jgi:hypothetical protein
VTGQVTAEELRVAILAHLKTCPPLTAYAISAALRQHYPYGASTPPVQKALEAMEGAGTARKVMGQRTRTDKRQAVRWELAPEIAPRGETG